MSDEFQANDNYHRRFAPLADQIRLHRIAAEQMERAAEHNRKAALCYEQGDLEGARLNAFVAEGHYLDAGPLAEQLSALATTLRMLGCMRD